MSKYPALKVWILVAFLGLWLCPSVLRAVEIVRNGRPVAVILVADEASPVAFEAAEELARVVEKATGARILTFPESELKAEDKNFPADRASKILVGDGETVRKLGVDVSTLPPEGFVIKAVGRYLILAGRDERHTDWSWRAHRQPIYTRGTWYAVCTFLENYLGARWLWPGELGEVVPAAKDIRIDDTDRQEAPALVARVLRANCFYGGHWRSASLQLGLDTLEQFAMHQELVRWVDHQRLGTSLTLKSQEFGKHWLDAFAEEHPDWFAIQPNGKRLLTHAAGRVRMCLSNPELIDEVVRRTVKYLDEHPNADAYGFCPSDVYGAYCVCEDCRAWGRTSSDLIAHHAAIVGQKVQALRPGKFVAALAYHKYVAPPETQVRFPDNVVLSYVGPNVFGYLWDQQHRLSVAYWDGWAKVAQKIIWRPNNFVSIMGVPRVYTTKLGADFRHFYRSNMIGTDFDRLSTNFAMDGLNYYVAARLTWNPEAPVEAMVADYCQKGFGPAAGAVHDYFTELEKITTAIAAARMQGNPMLHLRDDPVPAHFTPGRLASLRGHLDRARDLADSDNMVVKRIDFLAEALDFAEIEAPLFRMVQKSRETPLTEEALEEMRELLDRRTALCKDRCDSWAVDVAALSTGQKWFEKQLRPQPESETTDELPEQYEAVMQLPEKWKFKLDPDLVGDKQRWFADDHDDSEWKEIRVGEYWEKQGYPDFDGMAWYRLRVNLPSKLSGKQTELWFGGADETAKVYVNGKVAGDYDFGPQGWWTPPERRQKPFVIDVTPQIKPGRENLIAVRVIDTNKVGGLWKPVKVVIRY